MEKLATQKVTLSVADGTSMNAYVARPAVEDRFPGIIVLQEAFGVNAHIRDITERIAREGYVAIAPELYHRTAPGFEAAYADFTAVAPHMKAVTEQGAIEDLRAAYQYLHGDPQVVAERIASVGFCMGGRMSFLACSELALSAAISFYGGGIAPAFLARASNLSAPMLFFWGGLDKHIPQDQIRSVTEEMTRLGKTYVNVYFSDADHGFFCDARPSYNPTAAKLAWALLQQFLDTYAKGHGQKARGA